MLVSTTDCGVEFTPEDVAAATSIAEAMKPRRSGDCGLCRAPVRARLAAEIAWHDRGISSPAVIIRALKERFEFETHHSTVRLHMDKHERLAI